MLTSKPAAYLWATAAVAAAVAAGQALSAFTPLPNVSLIFLIAVLFAAVCFGMWPAVYASLVSFLAYDFFFIAPLYTFTVAQPHELLALVTFLIVAVITSALAGRVRDQALVARERMRATRRLYDVTRRLSGLATVEAVADGAAGEVHTSLRRATIILLKEHGGLSLVAAWPPEDSIDPESLDAARWAFACNEPAGADTQISPAVPWSFVPLRSRSGTVGVMGVSSGGIPLDPETRTLLEALADQIAAAIERALLTRETLSARTEAETERVRNTLLASVSHDFRTPLASILGAATSLLAYRDKLDPAAQNDLLGQIKNEADTLDRMVRNLLAITRIDARALELRYDWVDIREVFDRVVSAARRRGAAQDIVILLPETLPIIRADASLVEQALGNVVQNAILHTPNATRVVIDALIAPESLSLRVSDDGPGISAEMLPHVFDKFVRGRSPAAPRRDGGEGTGLGLAIAKGIVDAHGGSAVAESPLADGRGTRIVLTFPRADTST